MSTEIQHNESDLSETQTSEFQGESGKQKRTALLAWASEQAYKEPRSRSNSSFGNYVLDKKLSNRFVAVYEGDQGVVIAHRGTSLKPKDIVGDFTADYQVLVGSKQLGSRLTHAAKVQQKVYDSYGPETQFYTTGHSLGGTLAKRFALENDSASVKRKLHTEVFNEGSSPMGLLKRFQSLDVKETKKRKRTDLITHHIKGDIISQASAFHPEGEEIRVYKASKKSSAHGIKQFTNMFAIESATNAE